jgi:peroxiredoxin
MMKFGLGTALPGTVVIDRNGRVAKVISGIIKKADLKKQIDSMLATAEQARSKPSRSEVSSVPS